MPDLYSVGYLLVLWTIIYLLRWVGDKLDESTERSRREMRARKIREMTQRS